VRKSHMGSDLTIADMGVLTKTPILVFPAAADLVSAPPDRAASLVAAVLLAASVELHPLDGSSRPHERWSTSGESLSLALLPGCPPQTPTPASHR
jgi:hypothetical protein